jgi:hypothetical protein
MKRQLLAPTVSLLIFLSPSAAFTADPPASPVTEISEPVELITNEKFDRPEAFAPKGQKTPDRWLGGIGEWSIVDGAAYAVQEAPSEKRPNGHEAVCEYITDLGDLIFTAEFKLGASPQVGFVCRDTNSPNLHQGRVQVTPTAIWVQKMSGIAKETRREELQKIEVAMDPEIWHRITIEISGDRWLARIDDNLVLDAKHERFRDRKGRVGFVARGEGAEFRNVSIWSAKPKS